MEQVFEDSDCRKLEFVRGSKCFSETTPTVWIKGDCWPPYGEIVTRYPLCGASKLNVFVDRVEGQSELTFGLISPHERRPQMLALQNGERLTGKLWAWNSKYRKIFNKPFDSRTSFGCSLQIVHFYNNDIRAGSVLSVFRDLKTNRIHFAINGKEIMVSFSNGAPDFYYGYVRLSSRGSGSKIQVTLVPEKDEGYFNPSPPEVKPADVGEPVNINQCWVVTLVQATNKVLSRFLPDLKAKNENQEPAPPAPISGRARGPPSPPPPLRGALPPPPTRVEGALPPPPTSLGDPQAPSPSQGALPFPSRAAHPSVVPPPPPPPASLPASPPPMSTDAPRPLPPSTSNGAGDGVISKKVATSESWPSSPDGSKSMCSQTLSIAESEKEQSGSLWRMNFELLQKNAELRLYCVELQQQCAELIKTTAYREYELEVLRTYHSTGCQKKEQELEQRNKELEQEIKQQSSKQERSEQIIRELEQIKTKLEDEIQEQDATELDRYEMEEGKHGICLVINNFNFPDGRKRRGAEIDEKKIVDLFRDELQFKVEVRQNLNGSEILKVAKEIAARDHSQYNEFVFIIMSHGDKDAIEGVDGAFVKVVQLMSQFSARDYPTLRNKPKLFFIQACRGELSDPRKDRLSTSLANTEGDGIAMVPCPDSALANGVTPLEADFLLSFATVPGYKAYRSEEAGSWYIHALADVIRKYHRRHHLLDMLTKVNKQVAAIANDYPDVDLSFQVPAESNTLRAQVFL